MDIHIIVAKEYGTTKGLHLINPRECRTGTAQVIDTIYIDTPTISVQVGLKAGRFTRTVIKEEVDGERVVSNVLIHPVRISNLGLFDKGYLAWPILSSNCIHRLPAPVQLKAALLAAIGKGAITPEMFSSIQ
jgi:hypothetical protein